RGSATYQRNSWGCVSTSSSNLHSNRRNETRIDIAHPQHEVARRSFQGIRGLPHHRTDGARDEVAIELRDELHRNLLRAGGLAFVDVGAVADTLVVVLRHHHAHALIT